MSIDSVRRPTPRWRSPGLLAGAALLVVGGASIVAFAASDSGSACSATGRSYGHGEDKVRLSSAQDVDGDGTTDLALGSPAAYSGAGAVDLRFSFDYRRIDATGLRRRVQRVHESTFRGLHQHPGDAFGAASALLRANGDHCADVAVGAPGVARGKGKVVIAYGSAHGLATRHTITISGRTAGERFGTSIVAEGKDLWIAAPARTVAGARAAGAVDHYRISGSHAVRVQTLDARTAGIAATPRGGDGFGSSLGLGGGTLVIGEPGADVSGARDAGAIVVVRSARGTIKPLVITQNTPGVSGVAAAGNRFGAAVSADDGQQAARGDKDADVDVVVGAPGTAVGGKPAAGAAYVFDVPARRRWTQYAELTQDSAGVPLTSQAGAHLGASVYVGGFSVRDDEYGDVNVAVGAPGADVGTQRGAGLVDTFRVYSEDDPPVSAPIVLHRGVGGRLGGVAKAGDALGTGLSGVAFTDEHGGDYSATGGAYLAIGVPGDDTGAADAGAVVLAVVTTNTQATHRAPIVLHDSGGSRARDRFGVPAATVGNGTFDLVD